MSAFNKPTIFELHDTITFGKYKGREVIDVIDEDAQYIDWAFSNIEWFDLDSEAMDYLTKTIKGFDAIDFKYKDWDDH